MPKPSPHINCSTCATLKADLVDTWEFLLQVKVVMDQMRDMLHQLDEVMKRRREG